MIGPLEVPRLEDLRDFSIVIEELDEPGVVSIKAWAGDGDTVTLTWDEVACSAHIRWLDGEGERLVLERETASKVSVRDDQGSIQFRVWTRSNGLASELVVHVGARVSVQDAMLRV